MEYKDTKIRSIATEKIFVSLCLCVQFSSYAIYFSAKLHNSFHIVHPFGWKNTSFVAIPPIWVEKKQKKNRIFVPYIINKKGTIVFNIGDSRCYIYKNKKLIQITEDDSDVWLYHKMFNVRKDHLRYIASSNVINACIGISHELCNVSVIILSNNYDGILLFTDGVTDLLTDRKILNIIKKK